MFPHGPRVGFATAAPTKVPLPSRSLPPPAHASERSARRSAGPSSPVLPGERLSVHGAPFFPAHAFLPSPAHSASRPGGAAKEARESSGLSAFGAGSSAEDDEHAAVPSPARERKSIPKRASSLSDI